MRKISTNILFAFLGEILLFSLSFLVGVLIARYLGAAGKGSFWIICNVATLLPLIFSIRFRRSVTYYISKDKDMLGEVILYGLFVGIVTVSCVAIVATFFSSILYKTLLKSITTNWAILVVMCFSRYLWALVISIIEGLLLFKEKAVFMGGSHLLRLLLVFSALGILKLKFDDLILFMGSVETVVYLLIIMIFLGKAKHFHINVSSFQGMLKYSAGSFPGMVSDVVTLRIGCFFVNYFSGPAQVGIYTVAASLASMLLYLPAAARSVLMPYVARFPDKEITAKLSRLLIIVMIVLSVILIPLVWVSVIPIYGKEFSYSRILFLILLPGSILWGVFILLASDIEGRGLPWRISKVSMMSGLATVVLSLILIPIWNSTGAAVVSSITYGISMILAARSYKRMMGVNIAQLLIPKVGDLYSFFRITNHVIVNIREKLSANYYAKRPEI